MINSMKKIIVLILSGVMLCSLEACGSAKNSSNISLPIEESESSEDVGTSMINSAGEGVSESESELIGKTIINEEGMTLAERISVPEGYTRTDAETGSLAEFLRDFPLKEAGSDVLLYNGSSKRNQSAHVAVFDLPIEEYDLQQCADSIMRVYAEYYWSLGQYDKIAFHFTNGFLAEYSKWRDGYRITVDGNAVSWNKSASFDDSYECFVKFMKIVFTYAGTLSMDKEAEKIELSDMEVGDVFLYGASPGHVVMIVDVCENENGKKAFLLGQGYMPAQEFHLLKNNKHAEDPWYYEDEVEYPFITPEYTFHEGTLKRLLY